MASTKSKAQEKETVIEEECGIIERTTQQISPPSRDKRKRDEDVFLESPNKYRNASNGNRSATTSQEHDSLSVPFWKNLNRRQSSAEFHTTEIGTFSLLTRANEKECFEDKRYLRSTYFLENRSI